MSAGEFGGSSAALIIIGQQGNARMAFGNPILGYVGLDMQGNGILNVGDVECDSITRDGVGDILFNDRLDMQGLAIVNAGDVACDSLTSAATNILVNDIIDMNGLAIGPLAQAHGENTARLVEG